MEAHVKVGKEPNDLVSGTMKCSPIVRKVMSDSHSYEKEETVKQILEIRTKKELLFGEVAILLLYDMKDQVSPSYFKLMYYSVRKLETLYDRFAFDILEKDVASLSANLSKYGILYANRILKKIQQSSYVSKQNTESGKKGYYKKVVTQKTRSYDQYVSSINFSDDYVCPPNIRFETFFKYFLLMKKEYYSGKTLSTYFSTYAKLDSLSNHLFRHIRGHHILKCVEGLTLQQKNCVIDLYRLLDKFAYEKDVISKRHSTNLQRFDVKRKTSDLFSGEDVERVMKNKGEISTDITLILLYTGIALREIVYLEPNNIDEGFIHIKAGTSRSAKRSIPIHPQIEGALKRWTNFLGVLKMKGASEASIKSRVTQMVRNATKKHCGKIFTPTDCRRSFANQLLSLGVSRATVEKLYGTQGKFLHRHEHLYVHQPIDRLLEAIHTLGWEGGGGTDEDISELIC